MKQETHNPLDNSAPINTTQAIDNNAYENNPFFIGVRGLELLFKKARSVGIFLIILVAFNVLSSAPSLFTTGYPYGAREEQSRTIETNRDSVNTTMAHDRNYDKQVYSVPSPQHFADQMKEKLSTIPGTAWLIIAILAVFFLLVVSVIVIALSGIRDYTSAQIAHGRTTTLGIAVSETFSNFFGYTWVKIIVGLKTFLWTLLLIVPGFVMSVRYSLAGVVYFDKKLKGNASVAESVNLTRNGWLTTHAGQSLLPIITLGSAGNLFTPGTRAVLYRQFLKLAETGKSKPHAHIISWLTLLVPLILAILVTILVILVATAFAR